MATDENTSKSLRLQGFHGGSAGRFKLIVCHPGKLFPHCDTVHIQVGIDHV